MDGHGPLVKQLSASNFVKAACAGSDLCEASWNKIFSVLSLQTIRAEPVAGWCTACLYFVCSNSLMQLLIWCELSHS